MEYPAHLARRQYQVGLGTIFAQQEAEAIAVAEHLALDQIELVDQRIGGAAVAQHLAVALHGSQATTHGLLQVFIL